jgi:RNA polymerase sigma-70 factor (ECF subfamily)
MYPCEEDLPVLLAMDRDRYFSHLVLTYQHKLYALALGLVGNHQDAEEIVWEASFSAYQAFAHYTVQQVQTLKLRSWMSKIVVNLARNHHRRKNGSCRPAFVSFDTAAVQELVENMEANTCPSPEMEMVSREARDELYTLVAKLPESYREVVSLHFIYGLQYREIAALLNHHSVDTVKSQARRGIQILKQALEQQVKKEER